MADNSLKFYQKQMIGLKLFPTAIEGNNSIIKGENDTRKGRFYLCVLENKFK